MEARAGGRLSPATAGLLIIGAGYLGEALARLALQSSWRSVHLARRTPRALAGAQTLAVDVTDPTTLAALPEVGTVVYCVAADRGEAAAYEQAYCLGLQHVVARLAQWAVPPRLLFVSSTSVYAEAQGGWVEEETGELVRSGPSLALVRGEEWLRQAGLPWNILRFGGIYGPDRLYFLRRVRQRAEWLFKGPPFYSNRIHRDDGARLILHLAERPDLAGDVFNAVDDEPADRNQVVTWLHQALGQTEPLPWTEDQSLIPHRGNKRCVNRKIRATGFQLAYPSYREGYGALIADGAGV